jgi:hypothetical protein
VTDLCRVYDEVGKDGYPAEWHKLTYDDLGCGLLTERKPGLKHLVREHADHRCVRCHHPYRNGEHGDGEWSRCDWQCAHDDPLRVRPIFTDEWHALPVADLIDGGGTAGDLVSNLEVPMFVEAQWRILTVHHLNGNKADCRWWNLASLCQRCHLTIQGRVLMERVWPWEHSDWFKPYVAGYYASVYLGEELSREQTVARLDELLALERQDVPA